MNQILLALAGAIGTAAVGVVGAWITQQIQSNDEERERQRAIKEAQDRISMIDAWVKAHATLSPTSQVPDLIQSQARRDLDAAYEKMREAAAQSPERRWIGIQEVSSRILLRNLNLRGAARLLRSVYYFSLFMIIIWAGLAIGEQKSWTDPSEVAASIFAFTLIGVIPAWILARITVALAGRSDLSGAEDAKRDNGLQRYNQTLYGYTEEASDRAVERSSH